MVSSNRIETKIRGIVREELNPIKEDLKSRPTREEVRQMIYDGVDIIRVYKLKLNFWPL